MGYRLVDWWYQPSRAKLPLEHNQAGFFMSSIVAICNLALSNIGKQNISSLTEASAEARVCRQYYDVTRDMLLQGYPWNFAGKAQSLAQVSNDRQGMWRFAYARPQDCIKIRGVVPRLDQGYAPNDAAIKTPYHVDGGLIYCDLSPAVLLYTFRQADPTKYSPLFIDALSWHLAVRLAMPLTRDPKIRADAWQVANNVTGQAQEIDASEERYNYWQTTDLIEGRS